MVQLADLERSMGRLEEALETVEKAISCLKTVLTQVRDHCHSAVCSISGVFNCQLISWFCFLLFMFLF